MKILWNVQLEMKDGTTIEKEKCPEYGFSQTGTMIYIVEKPEIGNMESNEKITWLDMALVNKINLTRRTIFETKKELKEFNDQH